MKPSCVISGVLVSLLTIHSINVQARPGVIPLQHLYYNFPSASQQTTVIRDVLGNQGTAYAYQNHDGISSSAVAVSRSDNSKTLAYVPAVAPVVAAAQPFVYAHQPFHHQVHYNPALTVASPALAYTGYHSYV